MHWELVYDMVSNDINQALKKKKKTILEFSSRILRVVRTSFRMRAAALYCRLLPLLLLANMATTSSESEGWYDCKYEFCVKAKFAFFAVCNVYMQTHRLRKHKQAPTRPRPHQTCKKRGEGWHGPLTQILHAGGAEVAAAAAAAVTLEMKTCSMMQTS